MSTQHTPGPWVAIDGRILPERYVLTGAPIATVHARKVAGMRAGNASLIAAAPDMYEALKHEAEWHEAQARTHKTLAQRNPGMVYDGLKEAWHRERAATLCAVLAKAEGKS